MTRSDEDGYLRNWVDDPRNPLIEPPRPEFLLGDPAVILPGDAPDGCWHMFANTLLGIGHYTSRDGLEWLAHRKIGPGFRAFVLKDEGLFYMFYERFAIPQFRSHVAVRRSEDLWTWTPSETVLSPSLPWEGGAASRNVGNPCVLKIDGGYRPSTTARASYFIRTLASASRGTSGLLTPNPSAGRSRNSPRR